MKFEEHKLKYQARKPIYFHGLGLGVYIGFGFRFRFRFGVERGKSVQLGVIVSHGQ